MAHSNSNTNRYPERGKQKHQEAPRPKKTMQELINEVVQSNFKDIESDLLLFSNVANIKAIFSALEKFIHEVSNGLTTSQLRNVYSKILDAKEPIDLQLVRPNLAYVAARQDNQNAKKFMAFVDYLIQQVDSSEKQKKFNKLMEAMVAYHKYETSKN